VYPVNNTVFDVFMTAGFGILAYLFSKLGCEGAPLMLGFVPGPMMEENFRRSLLLSHGDFSVFFSHPLSLALLCATVLLIVLVALPAVKKKRTEAFQEE
jgi:TctA family transporter